MRQKVRLDANRIGCIGASQANAPSALGAHDTAPKCPSVSRQLELCRVFGARQWRLRLTSLQIRSLQGWIAFPEECRLSHGVTRLQSFPILPDTIERDMILEILPD